MNENNGVGSRGSLMSHCDLNAPSSQGLQDNFSPVIINVMLRDDE